MSTPRWASMQEPVPPLWFCYMRRLDPYPSVGKIYLAKVEKWPTWTRGNGWYSKYFPRFGAFGIGFHEISWFDRNNSLEFTKYAKANAYSLFGFHVEKLPFNTFACISNSSQRLKNHMGISKNGGTPKSSILIGFSTINHPFSGTPIFGSTPILVCKSLDQNRQPISRHIHKAWDFMMRIYVQVQSLCRCYRGQEWIPHFWSIIGWFVRWVGRCDFGIW